MNGIWEKTIGGMRWTGGAMLASSVLQLLQLIALARLLEPTDFGLMAMVMVVINVARIGADFGLGDAVVQQDVLDEQHFAGLFWSATLAGGIGFLLVCGLAAPVAGFFAEPRLEELLQVAAAVLLLSAWGGVLAGRLQHGLQFGALAGVQFMSVCGSVLVGISLAWFGWGVWSLVWGQVVEALVRSVSLLWIGRDWNYRPGHGGWKVLRPYFGFGRHRMGAKLLNFLGLRIDRVIIGRIMGAESLGYYAFAFNFVFQIIENITPLVSQVAFPIYARLQNDRQQLGDAFFRILRLLLGVSAPAMIGLTVTAELAVGVVFGEEWLPALTILQCMTFYGLVQSLMVSGQGFALGVGRAREVLLIELFILACNPVVVLLIVKWGGIAWVALGLLGVTGIGLSVLFSLVVVPELGPCGGVLLGKVLDALLPALVMGGGVVLFGAILPELPSGLEFLLVVMFGAGLFVVLTRLFWRETYVDLMSLLLPKK